MADIKLSQLTPTTVVTAVTSVPVLQDNLNKLSNIGQIKSFIKTPVTIDVASGTIPLSYDLVRISGNCTLPAATLNGIEIKIVSTAAGKIISTGLLPNDGMTFSTSGCTLYAVWSNSIWNIFCSNGMTSGII